MKKIYAVMQKIDYEGENVISLHTHRSIADRWCKRLNKANQSRTVEYIVNVYERGSQPARLELDRLMAQDSP
jgi:hypothetical protein